jgi:hypothetical protein
MHVYEVRSRKNRRGFDLISDALPFGQLWYLDPALGKRNSVPALACLGQHLEDSLMIVGPTGKPPCYSASPPVNQPKDRPWNAESADSDCCQKLVAVGHAVRALIVVAFVRA